MRDVAVMLKAMHASEDLAAAREKAPQAIEKLRGLRRTSAAALVEASVDESLAYYAFPDEHWRRIRTNNPLERILRRSSGERGLSARSPTANPHSISPLPGSVTSQERPGQRNAISRCSY